MPDGTTLILGLVFGSIGMGYFLYGKRSEQPAYRWTGVALMIFPYFFENTAVLIALGIGLLVAPRFIDI
ncbi:MAG: hypothetical protein H6993_05365 [Pseudomonadales bacterium]|nr:hypothetical protein [Pseudomonadales bacterium]MCP5183370.1 hypothetical protein [Pseudomonadales bacterium]